MSLKMIQTGVMGAAAVAASMFGLKGAPPPAREPEATYFSYSPDELAAMRGLSSAQAISAEDVRRCDRAAFDLVARQSPGAGSEAEAAKLYAYLAAAQLDFARLSYKLSGGYTGSIDAVAVETLCAFFPKRCGELGESSAADAYSRALSRLVVAKAKASAAEDRRRSRPLPTFGWEAFPAQPIHASGQRAFVSPLQKRAAAFWDGGPGTKRVSGLWLEIASDHMRARKAPLAEILDVRAALATALAGAGAETPGSKSGHSAVAEAARAVLTRYYPMDEAHWRILAEECGLSRLWAGGAAGAGNLRRS